MIAKESTHWYFPDARPCYELPKAKGDGMKSPTLADARKLGLYPGYTTIANVAAKPGLVNWKLRNMLEAALTLPRNEGETLDAYADRVIEDAEAISAAARDRGTACHTAIEQSLRGEAYDMAWDEHIAAVRGVLTVHGIKWNGDSEKTFAHPLGYGGKVDLSWPQPGLLDFKTKDEITDKVKPYDEQIMQLAAYAMGVFGTLNVRAMNVFIGVNDKRVVAFEYTLDDLTRGWCQFKCLLDYFYYTTKLERRAGVERGDVPRQHSVVGGVH